MSKVSRLRRWWSQWWLVDIVGLVGLGLCIALAFVDLKQVSPQWHIALWPNLASGLLVVWLTVRLVEVFRKKRDLACAEEEWRRVRNYAFVRVIDAVDDFVGGGPVWDIPKHGRSAYYWFGDLYTWASADFRLPWGGEEVCAIQNEVELWELAPDSTLQKFEAIEASATQLREHLSVLLQQLGLHLGAEFLDDLLGLHVNLGELMSARRLESAGLFIAGHRIGELYCQAANLAHTAANVTRFQSAEDYSAGLSGRIESLQLEIKAGIEKLQED